MTLHLALAIFALLLVALAALLAIDWVWFPEESAPSPEPRNSAEDSMGEGRLKVVWPRAMQNGASGQATEYAEFAEYAECVEYPLYPQQKEQSR